jgi:hypothetical protein
LSSVVLPDPDFPNTATVLFFSTVNDTSAKAWT